MLATAGGDAKRRHGQSRIVTEPGEERGRRLARRPVNGGGGGSVSVCRRRVSAHNPR